MAPAIFGAGGLRGRMDRGRAQPFATAPILKRERPRQREVTGLVDNRSLYVLMTECRTRGDMLSSAVAFALGGARKLVRGLREELTEEERYRVADDIVVRLKQHGDPWRLSEELPPPGKGHSTS